MTNPFTSKISSFINIKKLARVTVSLSVACLLSAPMVSQAVLPEPVQAALSRAALSSEDISLIITPVGNKNNSQLPAVIHLIDKQALRQQNRQINTYTDDPYTHASVEDSAPSAASVNHETSKMGVATNTNTQTRQAAIVSHKPQIKRTPASTMKLIPSFVALDTLGADFVWFTRVYHSGIIVGERLYGDLIIQGSGDPKMSHGRLQDLLVNVQQAGIHHIEGDIIIDSGIFQQVGKNPAAFDNAPLRPYNASPDGFLVNFNSMAITSQPLDNGQARLSYAPLLGNYQLPAVINTRTANCSHARHSLAPQWQKNALTFQAKLPKSCREHVFYVAYPDAKDFAARVVTAKWQALGNTLNGDVITQEQPYYRHHIPYPTDTQTSNQTNIYTKNKHTAVHTGLATLALSPLPIVSYPSLHLSQQIYDINHFSNNVMTEQVTLSIGAYHHSNANPVKINTTATSLYQFGKASATDYPKALQHLSQWWQTHLNTPPPFLTNGSGLCRDCTVSAANIEELLSHAYHHPSFDVYVNSLGVAGVSGTILHHSERLPDSAAIGRAWIKTGTLSNVTAMAGYVKGQSGQDYVVVGLINSQQALNPNTARPVLDAMLDWTAQQ